jgi:hypothetical protein
LVRPRVLETTGAADTSCMRVEASGSGLLMSDTTSRAGLGRPNFPARLNRCDAYIAEPFLGRQALHSAIQLIGPGQVEETR